MSALDQELSSTILEVEKQLGALANFSAGDTRERLVKIEQKIKQLSSTLHHLQIRDTEDRKLAQQLTKAAADHDKKIKEIKRRVKEIKDELQGGGEENDPHAKKTIDELKVQQELIKAAVKKMDSMIAQNDANPKVGASALSKVDLDDL